MYPLLKLIILNLGFNINVFNNWEYFLHYKKATYGDFIWSANQKVRIKGYRMVYITVNTFPGPRSI